MYWPHYNYNDNEMIMLKLGVLSFVIIDFLCKFFRRKKKKIPIPPHPFNIKKKNM